MSSTSQDPQHDDGRHDAPEFRVWPPLAIGVPWLLGWSIERFAGDGSGWSNGPEIGWVLIGIFCLWNGWCLYLFRHYRTGLLPGQVTRTIVDVGPFRISRNPLYLGLLVLYVGGALIASSLVALLLVPLAWAGLHWGAVLPEERYLRRRVGLPYLMYLTRVPRWL